MVALRVLSRHARRHRAGQRFAVAGTIAALLLTLAGPVGAAAGRGHSSWTTGPRGRLVATHHIESARAAATLAAAHPRATAGAAPLHLAVPTGAPRHTNSAATPKPSGPTPQITVPDLIVATQFHGLGQAESGNGYPADPWVAVNSSYVVQVVNVAVRISNRAGTPLLTVPEWAMFGIPTGQLTSDARVIWDATHNRWVAEIVSFKDDLTFSLNYMTLAVSDGTDPTAGWTTYSISYTNLLPDFPSIASSGDKIVIADNLFDNTLTQFYGAHIDTITWSSVLAGGALSRKECVANDGSEALAANPRAAIVLSAANDVHLVSEAAFTDSFQTAGDQIYDRITGSGDCSTGQFIDETNMTTSFAWSPFTVPPDPRQPGPNPIDNHALDERPTDAIWMSGKLWWVSTFPVSYDAGATFNDEVMVWGANTFAAGTTPTANTTIGVNAGDTIDDFFGGIGLSRNGTLFISYSESSDSADISWYANRYAGGGLGTPQLLASSTTATDENRWGDYAGVATDPVGNGTVWATHMYVGNGGTWLTDVARLLLDQDLPTTPGAPRVTSLVSTIQTSNPNYRISWSSSNDANSGSVVYRVETSVDGGAFGNPTWVSGTSLVRGLPFGHTYRFQVTAFDAVMNASANALSSTVQPFLVQSPTSKSGTWGSSTSSNYSGGSTWYATAAGASATYSSTGVRSLAFVTTRASTRGSFKVYIDGVYKTTISAYSATTGYHRVLYQFTWSTPGTHSIKIVVVGTSGHPRVDVDAFVVLK